MFSGFSVGTHALTLARTFRQMSGSGVTLIKSLTDIFLILMKISSNNKKSDALKDGDNDVGALCAKLKKNLPTFDGYVK